MRSASTPGSYKNTPFAWSAGTGRGAWGLFVHTPGRVAHGVGLPDWSHRSYALVVDDEALDLFLFAADTPAGVIDLYTQLTGRAPEVPRWSLGLWVSRAYYKTPEEAIDVARSCASAASLRRDHARRPRGVERQDALRLQWDRAFHRCAHRTRSQGASPAGLRLGVSLRLDPQPAVRAVVRARLPAQERARRSVRVLVGHDTGHVAVRRRAHAVAGQRDRRLHPSGSVRVVAMRTSRCSRPVST